MDEIMSESYERLQSYADVLDEVEYICKALAEAEDTDGNSEAVRWRAKGYKEIYDKIIDLKGQRGLMSLKGK